MTAKDRVKQFIDFKHITVNKFCKNNLLSNSFFNNSSAIGSDKLLNIFNNHPDLNMDWVITGRGEMIFKRVEEQHLSMVAEPEQELITKEVALNAKYQKTILDSYTLQIAFLKSQIADKEKIITLQNEKIDFINSEKK